MNIEKEKQKLTLIVIFKCSYCAMHSFNFIKIFSFDISNLVTDIFIVSHISYFLQFASNCVCYPHMFSPVEGFLFISSSGFSCFCQRVCSRTRKPQKVLISTNFFEVLRFNLILSTFLSIPCAQDTTLIKQCSKVSPNTYH